ncbi:MAG: hypothetical protein AB1782_06015 [Cyanobacteriota bacterium]
MFRLDYFILFALFVLSIYFAYNATDWPILFWLTWGFLFLMGLSLMQSKLSTALVSVFITIITLYFFMLVLPFKFLLFTIVLFIAYTVIFYRIEWEPEEEKDDNEKIDLSTNDNKDDIKEALTVKTDYIKDLRTRRLTVNNFLLLQRQFF